MANVYDECTTFLCWVALISSTSIQDFFWNWGWSCMGFIPWPFGPRIYRYDLYLQIRVLSSTHLRILPLRASCYRIFHNHLPIQWLLMHQVRAEHLPIRPCYCVYNIKVFDRSLSYHVVIRHPALGILLSARSRGPLPGPNIPPISLFHFCSYVPCST